MNKNKSVQIKVVLLALHILLTVNVKAQNFKWVQKGDGPAANYGNGVAVDASGNTYATGAFKNTITFGTTSFTSAGDFDFYLVKYDASGNLLWAKNAGGGNTDIGYGVAVDNGGNVYVTGTFINSIVFGTSTLTASSPGVFIVKYDAAGNVKWARQSTGSTSSAQGQAICVDGTGNIFIAGYFTQSITFGSIGLTSSGNFGAFVVKYDASGNVAWAKQNTGGGSCNPFGIKSDNAGNILITGSILGSSIIFGSTTLTGMGLDDAFLTKFDPSGNVLWAKSAGGPGDEQGNMICTDATGNVFLSGYFTTAITFGRVTLSTTAANISAFLVKYDTIGNVVWAKQPSSAQNTNGTGVAIDPSGNVYQTGYFIDKTTFGTLPAITGAGNEDVFVVKYNSSGVPLWVTSGGGNNKDVAYAAAANKGVVSIVGTYTSTTATFGSHSVTGSGAGGLLGGSIFVARIFDSAVSAGFKLPVARPLTMSIYPNPCSSHLHVDLAGSATNTRYGYYLLGLSGQKILEGSFNNQVDLNVRELQNGQYLLKLTDGENSQNNVITIFR